MYAKTKPSLSSITAAAVVLPGLLPAITHAAEDDSVDFQYSHYQESKRELYNIKSQFNPIEVDSVHGSGRFSLTERIKFAFNYTQDTWSGATPIATMPLSAGMNALIFSPTNPDIQTGASPYLSSTSGNLFLDKNNRLIERVYNPANDTNSYLPNNRLVHTMALASPEVRKQGDFKLTYEGNEAALDIGGGISVENDYESRFGNVGGRFDFNQKQTTASWGVSYTLSDTHAMLDHDALPYFVRDKDFDPVIELDGSDAGQLIQGTKQDWAAHLGLTQVITKNAVLETNLDYTRSTGYMENPYKAVGILFIDPENQDPNLGCPEAALGLQCVGVASVLEQRPDERNQWTGSLRAAQFIEPLDASVHVGYKIFSDDWGITSHTFDADWVQPLGDGWTLTPRIRYYSQDTADFYTPFITSRQGAFNRVYDNQGREVMLDNNVFNPETGPKYFYDKARGQYFDEQNNNVTERVDTGELFLYNQTQRFTRDKFPKNYSSDHRLSGFGALSGGINLTKQFTKGLSLEVDFEYYTHQGGLKIGGGGEDSYANFDYWTANAALKVDFNALSFGNNGGNHSRHHDHGAHAPAGVMFDHTLPKAGDFMLGYRYQWSSQGGVLLRGTSTVSDPITLANGCGGDSCYIAPNGMTMHMHMLDLMYAPTNWLTLMLMPQFMDMDMSLRSLNNENTNNLEMSIRGHYSHHLQNGHETGGIGDTGMYALFKLADHGLHHLHGTLGVSAPTGDVDIQLKRNHGMDGGFIHYAMQLGSGTWDFKPSLTYTGQSADWSWGAQANGTVRMENRNKSGYALGDIFQATAWGGFNPTNWLTASVRGVYTVQGGLRGQYPHSSGQFSDPDNGSNGSHPSIYKFGPMDYSANYGGKFWDIGLGLNAVVPSGSFAGNRLAVEWLQPVYTNVNGYQLDRDGALIFTWSYGF